jgi:hypothetical protein
MTYTVGERVLAIRNGEDHPEPGRKRRLFVFGEGVYVGDRPRPGTAETVPAEDAEAIRAVLAEEDAVPVEEHRAVKFVRVANGLEEKDSSEEVAKVIATITEHRMLPMEQRIEHLYRETRRNPCIHLDSGDIVWGFQSWWGPVEGAEKRFPKDVFEWVVVPVPAGNARWDES